MFIATFYKCIECGRITKGRRPKTGDGTLVYPTRHRHNGTPCPGNTKEAEWIDLPTNYNAMTGRIYLPKNANEP